tara:strand:+ start:4770 stop:4931 length:162 start_codon:yes stop_codon:yes gene_type:complete
MKNKHGIEIELGTVSRATHRTQDLIPTFLDAVRQYADAEYTQIMAGPYSFIPA